MSENETPRMKSVPVELCYISNTDGSMYVHEICGTVFVSWVTKLHKDKALTVSNAEAHSWARTVHAMTGVECVVVPFEESLGAASCSDLLACPFCAGAAELIYSSYDFQGWSVECLVCGASSRPNNAQTQKQTAIDDWNTRVVCGLKIVFRFEMLGKIGRHWVARSEESMFGPCSTLAEVYIEIIESILRGYNYAKGV